MFGDRGDGRTAGLSGARLAIGGALVAGGATLGLLSLLFGSTDELSALAKQGDTDRFILSLRSANICLLTNSSVSKRVRDRSEDEVVADIESGFEESATDRDEYRIFTYREGGNEVLPLFSSQQFAESFVQAHVNATGTITTFELIEIGGGTFLDLHLATDRYVLNARSGSEADCTAHFRRALRLE